MLSDSHWADAQVKFLNDTMAALTRSMQVLIVEDNAEDAELLKYRLRKYPCESTLVQGEHEAVALLRASRFDVVFLDLKLAAAGSGIGVMAAAAALPWRVSFVILTGHIEDLDVKKALEMGAVAVLEKPPTDEQMAVIFGKINS